jgi:hypothetical protein
MKWQPIETAPKTTKARLVWCPEFENMYLVTWDRDAWIYFGGRRRSDAKANPLDAAARAAGGGVMPFNSVNNNSEAMQ